MDGSPYAQMRMATRRAAHRVAGVYKGSPGSLIKRSIIDLIRGGCRIERIAHDPPTVTYTASDGVRGALRFDGRGYMLSRSLDADEAIARFHSLDAALGAARRPWIAAAS